jgi:general secretion pathway protein G
MAVAAIMPVVRGPKKYRILGIAAMIIAIVLAVGDFVLAGRLNRLANSKPGIARIQISEFESAIDLFRNDTSRYPATAEGLEALIRNPGNLKGWEGPYLKKIIPRDPWGLPYHLRCPGVHHPDSYDLWSDGKDGIEGSKDDIANFN